ncbi:MAG: tyrosine--tRNA ligase, partial [Actinobacteria bacterium]|nr:tyrosine--tRNA ligase [Actinomycetota bacterium]
LTSPLVTKSDGSKFGKSEEGNERIWLDATLTSPYRLYQFFLNTDDGSVGSFLRYFTFLSHEEITALDLATQETPQLREAQRTLAREAVTMIHGPLACERAMQASDALFSTELADLDEDLLMELFAEAPSVQLPLASFHEGLGIVDLAVSAGLLASKGEARRAVEQGGLSVNNLRVEGIDHLVKTDQLLHGRYLVLRRGRKSVAIVDAR